MVHKGRRVYVKRNRTVEVCLSSSPNITILELEFLKKLVKTLIKPMSLFLISSLLFKDRQTDSVEIDLKDSFKTFPKLEI